MSVRITIQTTPNAPKNQVVGWSDATQSTLKIKVKAPAVEGKANAELLRFLAEFFGVRPSAVSILRGETARLKVVEIEGVTPESVSGAIEKATQK